MFDLSETVYEDPSTMERICKIVSAIWSGDLIITNDKDTGITTFSSRHTDDNIKLEFSESEGYMGPAMDDIKKRYDVFVIANAMLQAIISLDDEEGYMYYCEFLEF